MKQNSVFGKTSSKSNKLFKINVTKKDFRMMEYYDKYLHHLWDKAEALEAEKQRLQAILDEEKQKLIKLEQAVKVLEKHKEKQKEAYLEEEKAIELRQFSEIGVQRFFIQSREKEEEEQEQLFE